MPKLSELDPADIQVMTSGPKNSKGGGLKLSDINSADIQVMPQADPAPIIAPPQQISNSESFLRSAGQSATAGFQDEATSALDAIAEKARELTTGYSPLKGTLREKYNAALQQNRTQNEAAAQANPGMSLLGGVVGATPLAMASGGGSLIRQGLAAGAQAALTSIGESQDQSALDATGNAAKAGVIGSTLVGLTSGALKIGSMAGKALLKGPVGAFMMSAARKASLADPKVAVQVGNELEQVGENLAQVSNEARTSVGQGLDKIAEKTNATLDPTDTLNGVLKNLNKFDTGRNEVAAATKSDLIDLVKQIGSDLEKPTPLTEDQMANGIMKRTMEKTSFFDLHKLKQNLGDIIFEQGKFSDNAFVEKQAKNLYHGLADILKKADTTGQYDALSSVYRDLSSADPEAFTANGLRYLQDPWDLGARNKMSKLLGNIQTMPESVRQAYIPKLASFIDQDLTNAALKAETIKNVGGKTGALFLKGVRLPTPSAIAAEAGASYGANTPQMVQDAVSKIGSQLPLAGKIGGGALRGATSILSSRYSGQ